MASPGERQRQQIRELRERLAAQKGLTERAANINKFRSRSESLIRSMARYRADQHLTQDDVASRMRTSQPAIARLEAGLLDPKLSTLERYAAAIGYDLNLDVAAQLESAESPKEVTVSTAAREIVAWFKSNAIEVTDEEAPPLELTVTSEEFPKAVVGYLFVQPKAHGIKVNASAADPAEMLGVVTDVLKDAEKPVEEVHVTKGLSARSGS